MAKARNAYEIALPDGRVVTLVELKTGELEQAFRLGGTGAGSDFRQSLEGLRLAVRKVGDKPMTYQDLQGELWDDQFSVRETMLLSSAWNDIHLFGAKETAAALGNVKATSGSF